MERSQTLGFILIFVVLVIWMWMNTSAPKPVAEPPAAGSVKDSAKSPPAKTETIRAKEPAELTSSPGLFFAGRDKGYERLFTVETDQFRAVISNKGGTIRSWELKNHKTWDGRPVEMVDRRTGDFGLLFGTSDGKTLKSNDLYFDAPGILPVTTLDKNNFEFEIVFTLPTSNGGRLVKAYRFSNDKSGADVRYEFYNLGAVIANYEVQVTWDHGVPFAEHNSVDESGFAAAYAFGGNELTEIDASTEGERVVKDLGGHVDWVAARNKYFGVALIPMSPKTEGAVLEGVRTSAPDNGIIESYGIALRMPFTGGASETVAVRLFVGPLDHKLLKSYENGLENIMSLGWAWVIRPLAEYVFLPLFIGIHYVVPNWGFVIIIFSIIIKIALHPLTRSSMKSMKKMQALQPMIKEIQEKHKDDPTKMGQAVTGLYKEYGVNPAGGCLPMLLQMPIMYALYAMFRSAIDLRQAAFVGWITDLSVPDVLFSLPFHLPLFGIKDLSGIALLMGITMFVQQKMTVMSDPRQKMMAWMMPIMFTLLFNSFPSGLNLYYAVFNVLAIVQQYWTNKQHEEEPLRKVEQKKKSRGGIFKYVKDIPRLKR
ncbi:MAG: hypothetical protein A2X67_12335 [Ignavibacteria bacterium GWA2_55_11]|nr:MAG: hypothetical protein A2X67_12335 [Ignavibacteria bacterium GWA2_55_11]